MANTVNVLLHGIFGYVFRNDHIEVYVPAVCGHIYKASRDRNLIDAKPLSRTEYALTGVRGGPRFQPDSKISPVLPFDPRAPIDEFEKRFCKINLPYPAPFDSQTNQLFALDSYYVGSIFAGRDAAALNSLQPFPSMHVFVYERLGDSLKLESLSGSTPVDLTDPKPTSNDDVTNLHIWCTTPPMDMSTHGFTPDGHLRRGFAALIDLFPFLEITIQIPDGFTPEAAKLPLPTGVEACDVDPGQEGCIHFGKANCHYANLLLWPTA